MFSHYCIMKKKNKGHRAAAHVLLQFNKYISQLNTIEAVLWGGINQQGGHTITSFLGLETSFSCLYILTCDGLNMHVLYRSKVADVNPLW